MSMRHSIQFLHDKESLIQYFKNQTKTTEADLKHNLKKI